MRTARRVLAAVALLAVLAACSSSNGDSTSVRIASRSLPGLGAVLVDGDGFTLYMFPPDRRREVTCTGPCAGVWPPVVVAGGGKPRAGGKVKQSLLGTVPNPDKSGERVVTYNGWPLYRYASDVDPGQANGQALDLNGGFWYVMRPSGQIVKTAARQAEQSP